MSTDYKTSLSNKQMIETLGLFGASDRVFRGISRQELEEIYDEVVLTKSTAKNNSSSNSGNNSDNDGDGESSGAAAVAAPKDGIPTIEEMRRQVSKSEGFLKREQLLTTAARFRGTHGNNLDSMSWWEVKQLYEEHVLQAERIVQLDRENTNIDEGEGMIPQQSSFDFFAVDSNGQAIKVKRSNFVVQVQQHEAATSAAGPHPAMSNVALLHKITQYESRSIGRIALLSTVSVAFSDALCNRDGKLWRDISSQRFYRAHLALLAACNHGMPWLVARLLSAGVDSNTNSGFDGRSALHYATANGHLPIIRFLLRAGANPQPQDKQGRTPLLALLSGATAAKRARGLQDLSEDDEDEEDDEKKRKQATAQQQQQQQQQTDDDDPAEAKLHKILAIYLTERRISDNRFVSLDANQVERDGGRCLLHYAAGLRNKEMATAFVAQLIARGARPCVVARKFPGVGTPLCVAAASGNINAVIHLISKGASLRCTDGSGRNAASTSNPASALHAASGAGQSIVCRVLCDAAARMATTVASQENQRGKNLDASGGDDEKSNNNNSVVGHQAIRQLVNYSDPVTGETSLHAAAANGHADVVKILLEIGANLELFIEDKVSVSGGSNDGTLFENAISRHLRPGWNAVHVAAAAGSVPVLRAIVHFLRREQHKRNINDHFIIAGCSTPTAFLSFASNTPSRRTALHLASEVSLEAVRFLVCEAGCRILRCRDADGSTPLMTALNHTDSEHVVAIADFLLTESKRQEEEGEKQDEQDEQSERGNETLVNVCNNAGRSPLHVAAGLLGNLELVKLLLAHGADKGLTVVRTGATPKMEAEKMRRSDAILALLS